MKLVIMIDYNHSYIGRMSAVSWKRNALCNFHSMKWIWGSWHYNFAIPSCNLWRPLHLLRLINNAHLSNQSAATIGLNTLVKLPFHSRHHSDWNRDGYAHIFTSPELKGHALRLIVIRICQVRSYSMNRTRQRIVNLLERTFVVETDDRFYGTL